jgi:DNA-directed RNA polymerase subunit E"
MVKELACRKCKCVTIGKICPACKSSDLTPDWQGIVIVANPEESRIAKTLKITVKEWKKEHPKYALKVT